MYFQGVPDRTGQFNWYTVRCWDSFGLYTDLLVAFIVDFEKPQITMNNRRDFSTTQYITEGLRYFFYMPDPLIYSRDYEKLTYLISDKDGEELPSWINFNIYNLEFSGIAPDYDRNGPVPTLRIKIVGMNPTTT